LPIFRATVRSKRTCRSLRSNALVAGGGIGRRLLDLAIRKAGGIRVDLITEGGVEFYEALGGDARWQGFRLHAPFLEGPRNSRPD
jgi:hypothetical protein